MHSNQTASDDGFGFGGGAGDLTRKWEAWRWNTKHMIVQQRLNEINSKAIPYFGLLVTLNSCLIQVDNLFFLIPWVRRAGYSCSCIPLDSGGSGRAKVLPLPSGRVPPGIWEPQFPSTWSLILQQPRPTSMVMHCSESAKHGSRWIC